MDSIRTTMHIEVDRQNSGWFPAIDIRYSRFSDIVFIALLVGLGVFIFMYISTKGQYFGKGIINISTRASLGILHHVFSLVSELFAIILNSALRTPISWYPIAALTIIPMTIDIPRLFVVLYLLAYCVANSLVLVYCINENNKENKQTKPKQQETTQPLSTRQLSTQFFTGMRITIDP
jgi:hypothetical protein